MFLTSFVAGSSDFDFDGRFRGASCLDRARDVRMMFFADHGFAIETFRAQGLLPMVLKERLSYQREIPPLDRFKISLTLAGLSADGSRFMVHSEVIRSDGKEAVRVTSTCGWLDTGAKKLILPPPQLITALNELPLSADYQVLLSTIK